MSENSPLIPRPAEWVIADCPACGKTMKLRRELVGKHALLCPSCRAPIAIDFAHPEPEPPPAADNPQPSPAPSTPELPARSSHLPAARGTPFAPAPGSFDGMPRPLSKPLSGSSNLPPVRSVLPFQEISAVGSSEKRVLPPAESKLPDEFVDKLKVMESDLPVRQKKRRRREADEIRLTDWDTAALIEVPEAEIRADLWASPGPDLLHPETMVPKLLRATAQPVELTDQPEGIERKRTRKGKRRVFPGQQLLRRILGTGRWGLLALILLIGGGAVWFLIHTAPGKAVVSASEPSAAKIEADASSDKFSQLSYDEIERSYKLVRQFLAADGWEAKSAFVRMPEKVKPLMKQWYDVHPSGPLSSEKPENYKKSLIGKTYMIFLALRMGPEKILRYFTVEQIPPATPNGMSSYLLDWETSVGYQPMELRDYMVKQPLEPLTFRVLCRPEAYYNYAFSDQDQWISYELTYPGDPDFMIHGYVKKGSAVAEELNQQLLLEANIMLQLRYPENPISREQVLIDKIVHRSWFYDRDEVNPVKRTESSTASSPPPL
jgi:hypothetical protein